MNDALDDLSSALTSVSGGDYTKSAIDDPIDHMKDVIKAADWVKPAIEGFRQPLKDLTTVNPSSFTDAITKFRKAALMLGVDSASQGSGDGPDQNPGGTVAQHMTTVKNTVTGGGYSASPPWTGDSADAFTKNFLPYYTTADNTPGQAIKNQAWMLSAMQMIVEAHQAVYVRTRQDVREMMKNASKAADQNTSDFSVFSSKDDGKFLMTIVAATLAVAVSIAAPEATALTIVAATATQTTTVFGAIPQENKKNGERFTISADSPGGMVYDMSNALTKIQNQQKGHLKAVKDSIDALCGKISGGQTRLHMVGPMVNESKYAFPKDKAGNESNGDSPLDDNDVDDTYQHGWHLPDA
ncbi:MAG TPA: hypothetical protein VE172_20450 [Stackebrandtia sp.]|jgi:hypothetical protein|uniref:hypothetical protein n=1 Tax=Stackebrandtia sp. TaxID=2023065 RepID=UPI002D4ED861|nr:hypothetical protein [Stackebrandtia sp.]HZE41177.1 hypothetical protein [Stackebrandtia sp.]